MALVGQAASSNLSFMARGYVRPHKAPMTGSRRADTTRTSLAFPHCPKDSQLPHTLLYLEKEWREARNSPDKELNFDYLFRSDQIRSVAQSCPTLCDPMNRGMPGLPVHHQLLEFTQTHVHRVSDAIQPSHPLSSPSPLAPNPSQHQSLFQ